MRKLIIIIGSILLIGVVGITLINGSYQSSHLLLKSTAPKSGLDSATVVEPVIFTFNNSLDKTSANNFNISPYIEGKVTITDKVLTFKPTTVYNINTTYTATVKNPKSATGVIGKNASTTFTTKYLDSTNLSDSQNEELQSRTDQLQHNNPLVGALPHTTLDYSMTYKLNADQSVSYAVELYIYNKYPNDAAYTAQYMSDLKRYKSEATDYIKAQGVDPATLNITYDPAEATGL